METKICTKCNKEKPIENFRLARKIDKYMRRAQCFECEREANREYWRNNPEKCKEACKKWRAENPETIRAYVRWYDTRNREKHKKINKMYAKEHPEKFREYVRRRRAKKRDVSEDYTKCSEEITRQAFDNQCFNCGTKEDLCIDHHRPLSRGFALMVSNAVVLCNICNSSKGNKMPEEFYGKEKLNKITTILTKLEEEYPNLCCKQNERVKVATDAKYKICTGCNVKKDIDEFSITTKRGKCIRRSRCKECRKEEFKKWAVKNTEERREYTKKFRQEHKDDAREYQKNYRQKIKQNKGIIESIKEKA